MRKTWLISMSTRLQLVLTVSLFAYAITAAGQELTLTITGRVVDENRRPVAGAQIMLESANGTHLSTTETSDESGRFSVSRSSQFGKLLYLFVSHDKNRLDNSLTPIFSPFEGLNRYDRRFLGKPFYPANDSVDLGEVPVQFWFSTVQLKVTKNGNELTKDDWDGLWYQLLNHRNKFLYGASPFSNEIHPWVDINTSTISFSLPEGNWKIDFYKRAEVPGFNYSRILASSGHFSHRQKQTLSLDIGRLQRRPR
jgi:Carboxypeptidase regulatory-like domain